MNRQCSCLVFKKKELFHLGVRRALHHSNERRFLISSWSVLSSAQGKHYDFGQSFSFGKQSEIYQLQLGQELELAISGGHPCYMQRDQMIDQNSEPARIVTYTELITCQFALKKKEQSWPLVKANDLTTHASHNSLHQCSPTQ
jgi:hypothetical protein